MSITRLGICLAFAMLAFAAPAQAIVGGKQTTRSWPHMAALEFRNNSGSWNFRCGASLVRPDVVLTAAHCIDGFETQPARFQLLLGTNDREAGGERIAAVQVAEHPSYDTSDGGYDVALLKLSRAAVLGAPIRIAGSADADRYEPGDVATIIGWGATIPSGFAERNLHEAEVPIRSDTECARNYTLTAPFDPETMICAGYLEGGADSCQGDSGGPLMVPDAAGKFVLVGAVSFGFGCAVATQYGVYSEVAGPELRKWIDPKLNELSPAAGAADGGSAAPPPSGTTNPTAAESPQPPPPPPPAGAVVPAGSPAAAAPAGALAPAAVPQSTPLLARVRVPLRLGSAARARRTKRLAVLLRTTAPLRGVRAHLRQRSRTVARGSLRRLSRRGRITLSVSPRLRPGPAVLTVSARDGDGRSIRLVRRVRLSR